MQVAIIGSGNLGTAIARAVTDAGHDAVVAGTDDDSLETLVEDVPVTTSTSNAEAAVDVDLDVLAVPFDAVQDAKQPERPARRGRLPTDRRVALTFARYLEGMAPINIALNGRTSWSWATGRKLVGPLS